MNRSRMSHGLVLALSAILVAACGGGEPPPPESPESPTPAAPEAPATPAADPAPAAPAADAPKAEPAAPAKPLKERVAGKWQFDFNNSDPFTKAQEDNKKKAGKDEKKFTDLMTKAQDAAAKEWIELTGDTYISYVGDKVVYKAKYEVVKEDGQNLIIKQVGKDEIGKKEMKEEMTISLKDDTTIQMKDPKKGMLTFKRK